MPQAVAFTRGSRSSELVDPRNAEWFGPARERAPQRAVRVGRRAARRLTAPTSKAKGVGRCPRRAVDRQVGSESQSVQRLLRSKSYVRKEPGATHHSEKGGGFHRARPALSSPRPELLSIPPYDRGRRLEPDADAATLVDIGTLGGNAPDDMLGG